MNRKYTNAELIEMIAHGGVLRETAVQFLAEIEERSDRLANQVRKLGATPEECQELFSDAVMALIKAIIQGRFKQGDNIWGYMYRVARNLYLKLRRDDKLPTASIDESAAQIASDTSADSHIVRGERRTWLLNALQQLSDKCRKILHLAYFEEKTNEEIALAMGYKSKKVVGVKKSECMTRLGKILKSGDQN